jgi:Galactosyltransferase
MNNQLIIAVKSHFGAMEAGAHDAIRGTWGQALRGRAQVKFFMGRTTSELGGMAKSLTPTRQNSYNPKSDEVILECGDDYDSLVWKTRAIAKWFVDKAASHILMVDSDCLVYPDGLWKSGFQDVDYMGRWNGGFGNIGPREIPGPGGGNVLIHDCYSWCSGAGYFMSKAAAMIIAEKTPIQTRYIMGAYEDFWVGQILGPYIQTGMLLAAPVPTKAVEYYLFDGHSKGYDPKSGWMERKWEIYQKGVK